ncbi:MAG: hypothetical protein HYS08_02625 [Chlamydiae bacterium]|nr:hypothetical protein [Chlamydiota bacterium]MBI3266625.1 hypothetical protein [Chlamydiota bacterium]
MRNLKKLKSDTMEDTLALSPQERVRLAESLYQEIVHIQKKRFKPFVKSFSSFEEYEKWKARQKDPWLW